MADRDVFLWDQVWSTLNSILDDGAKLQLVYPTISCNWAPPKHGYIQPEVYSIVNQMPQWSSSVGQYYPSATDLFSAYKCMISSCPKLTLMPDLRCQLHHAQEKIDNATKKWERDEEEMQVALAKKSTQPETSPLLLRKWLQKSGWKKLLDDDISVMETENTDKAQLIGKQNEGYQEAIDACEIPTGPKSGFARCEIDGAQEWCANYIIGDGEDWARQLTSGERGTPLNIHIESTKQTTSIETSPAQNQSNHTQHLCFFRTSGGRMLHVTEDFVIDIKIKAVTVVPIRQDCWYEPQYLALLAKKNWWNKPFTTRGGESAVFGEGGLLSLKISGLIAGCGISFHMNFLRSNSSGEMRLSSPPRSLSQELNSMPSNIGELQELHIGPFHFDQCSTNSNSMKNCISGQSSDIHPAIVGFVVTECVPDTNST